MKSLVIIFLFISISSSWAQGGCFDAARSILKQAQDYTKADNTFPNASRFERIGVEIEGIYRGPKEYSSLAKHIQEKFAERGKKLNIEQIRSDEVVLFYQDAGIKKIFTLKGDSSIVVPKDHFPLEMTTPAMESKDDFLLFREFLSILKEDYNFKPEATSSGLHIHYDMTGEMLSKVTNFFQAMAVIADDLRGLLEVNEDRYILSTKYIKDVLRQFQYKDQSREASEALDRIVFPSSAIAYNSTYQTIEFRLPNSTVEWDEVMTHINFFIHLIDEFSNNPELIKQIQKEYQPSRQPLIQEVDEHEEWLGI